MSPSISEDGRIPIFLDTDIGSDIDDALCLTYLLRQQRCDLLGVTTVTGQATRRAKLVSAVCKALGRDDIPIHPGADSPLLVAPLQTEVPQAEILSNWSHNEIGEPNSAVDFMRDTIRKRPGEITLLAVGPLTNIALLFKLDPEIPSLLKSLVMMVGSFTFPYDRTSRPVEWNARLDPHAAAIVYKTPGLTSYSVGLDVTTLCRINTESAIDRFNKCQLPFLAAATAIWGKEQKPVTFHDPLAAAGIFRPDLLEFRPGQVSVELGSESLMGMTVFNARAKDACHQIAHAVNPYDFFDEYFNTIVA